MKPKYGSTELSYIIIRLRYQVAYKARKRASQVASSPLRCVNLIRNNPKQPDPQR